MREVRDSVACKIADNKVLQNHGEVKQGDCSYSVGGRSELLCERFRWTEGGTTSHHALL